MAAGAVGPPGDRALGVEGQGHAGATTLPPAEAVSSAWGWARSRSPVRSQTSSTYSETHSCDVTPV